MLKYYLDKREENEKIGFIKKSNKFKVSKRKHKYKISRSGNKKIIFNIFFFSILFLLIGISIYYKFFSNSSTKIEKEMNINIKDIKEDIKYDNENYIYRNLSYDENAKMIYSKNKVLNFNQLDKYYYGIIYNDSNFNHIHISFSFNNSYYLLASITITNILKISNPDSFIHFHIITVKSFELQTMKKLNSLKEKINNNSEFIFYDGSKRVEQDFGKIIYKEKCGAGEYGKLLVAVLLDKSIDRVLNLDAGDLLVEKDLLELYNYPLEDYLIRGVIDPYAKCFAHWNFIFKRINYTNAGVYIYNLKKWREMNIYEDIIKFYNAFHYHGRLIFQHQDVINGFLPTVSIGLLPLKFNFFEYIFLNQSDEQEGAFIYKYYCSYYFRNKKPAIEAEKNIVIRHYNHHKVQNGKANRIMTKKWKEYANMTGFYEDICRKYPKGCNKNTTIE